METSTQFDLNETIQRWRASLGTSPAFRAADLDELEGHLRDSISVLQSKGLSQPEAFWVAMNRLGNTELLNSEFGKVNLERVWLSRALWMVAGSLAIGFVSSLVSSLAGLAALGARQLTMNGHLVGLFSLLVYLLAFGGLLAAVWRSVTRNGRWVWRAAGWAKTHPGSMAAIVFAWLAVNALIVMALNVLAIQMMPMQTFAMLAQWRSYGSFLVSMVLWPLLLAWLLVRTNRTAISR
jgi:hypothetical protein